MRKTYKIIGGGVLLAGLVILLKYFPVGAYALSLVEWVRGAGATGVIVYIVAYAAATVLFLPGSILTLGAGFVYGPLFGLMIVSPASVLGATLAFILGRSVARGWVEKQVAGNPRFAAIDRAVGKQGFKIVFLLRLSPIFPFNLLNYALALTGVRLWHYVLASFIGMLPGTFMYVYLGSLLTSASQLLSGERPEAGLGGQLLYWGGLLATIVVTVYVTRLARAALKENLGEEVVEADEDELARIDGVIDVSEDGNLETRPSDQEREE